MAEIDDDALAVARRAWDRWIAADLEGVLAMWAPDGEWTLAGHSQISGTWRGPDEIAKVAQAAFELSGGTLKARPLELAAAGDDSVLGYYHVEASRPEATMNQNGLQRFVIRDGKMVSLHNLFEDLDEFDIFYE